MATDKNFPSEVIDLPSKGWFYDPKGPLASGKLELKYLTAREEDILTSRNLIQKGIVLDKLIESLVVDKTIPMDDLLIGDKDGIFVATRILGYGKEYPITTNCPVCGTRNDSSVDLTKIDEKPMIEPIKKGSNLFEFTLPVSQKKLTYKFLTHGGERAINDELDAMKKVAPSDIDHTASTRLKYLIVAIDGNSDQKVIREFIDNQFLVKDSRAFRDEYNKRTPGLDLSFDFSCQKCGVGRRLALPIGLDFFWPLAEV